MKKILLAFDGDNFSKGAFDFAAWLNQQNTILLSGIFLPEIVFAPLATYPADGAAAPGYLPLTDDEYVEVVAKNIEQFKMLCLENGIEHRIHKDFADFPLQELRKESRYADLLILGSESFYNELGTKKANIFLENMLQHSECPVLVVPEKFTIPESIMLTYNGSQNSLYSIKLFAYLFPELNNKPTTLVFCDGKQADFPEQSNIEELATRHFSDLSFLYLDMGFKEYFQTWTIQKSPPVVVAGSYGRSAFSQLFHKSFMGEIISDHKAAVFIAHK